MNLVCIMVMALINSLCFCAADMVDKSRPVKAWVDKEMVYYKCSKGKPICFEAKLLDQSSVAKTMLNGHNGPKVAVHHVVKTLFKDYTPDQVRFIVRALALENQIQRDLIDNDMSDVDVKRLELPKKRFLWLAEQAHELGIKNIYQELICNIARMTESLSAAYHEGHVLQEAIEQDIVQCMDLYPYQKAIRALTKTEFPETVSGRHYEAGKGCLSKDGSRWLVTEGSRVRMHSLEREFILCSDCYIRTARFTKDDQHILVIAENGAFLYDSMDGKYVTDFGPNLENSLMALSDDTSLVLEVNKDEISLLSVEDNTEKWHYSLAADDKCEIKQAIISPDNRKIFISKVRDDGDFNSFITYSIYDVDQKVEHKLARTMRRYDWDRIGEFSADSSKMLLYNSGGNVDIYDLNIMKHKQTVKSDVGIAEVCFADNDTKILFRYYAHVALYNMQTGKEEWSMDSHQKNLRQIKGVALSDDATQILLAVEKCKPIVFPVLNKTSLSLAQILLMEKAVGQWRAKKPYYVQPEDYNVYRSLPASLQTDKLFAK